MPGNTGTAFRDGCADRAILVETAADIQPLAVAKLLKAIAANEAPATGDSRQTSY
jgi:electron transfer flavoprotein alpha/beta subunit